MSHKPMPLGPVGLFPVQPNDLVQTVTGPERERTVTFTVTGFRFESLPISHAESVRLHEDWWGKCRTCRFWHGQDEVKVREGHEPLVHLRWHKAPCDNPASPLHGETTSTEGHCSKWDSFDVDTALAVLDSR